jgi:hypothetical protein
MSKLGKHDAQLGGGPSVLTSNLLQSVVTLYQVNHQIEKPVYGLNKEHYFVECTLSMEPLCEAGRHA